MVGEPQPASAGFSARSTRNAAPMPVIRPNQGSSGAIAEASAAGNVVEHVAQQRVFQPVGDPSQR